MGLGGSCFSAKVRAPASICLSSSVRAPSPSTCISRSASSCRLLYEVPISRPKMQSRHFAMGQVKGSSRMTRGHTMTTEAAPIRRPCRLQMDCGMISPKVTMTKVEISPPTRPDVIDALRMAMRALTRVLPRRSVQRSRLPDLRRG
eukprot:scaffold119065_cov63-Phaeocystis_antarctica.AAC.3